MSAPNNTTKTYFDELGSFEAGVNSGVEPTLLPKNQLAFSINATVRGGQITQRPPFQKMTLDYGGDTALQAAVEGGFFQGANSYRPDFGPSQIVAQISGRLFTFTITGSTCTVAEVTISGDANDATTNQVWMWQSEKWLIISDGSGKLPIFYDGISCRRSYGPSVVLGTTVAVGNFPTPRVIGEVITVTTAANWEHPAGTAGPFNVPVIFNGAFYQPIVQSTATPTYNVILTNLNAVVAASEPIGSQLTIQPNAIGTITSWSVALTGFPAYTAHVFLTSVSNLLIGDNVFIAGLNPGGTGYFTVINIDVPTKRITIHIPNALSPTVGAAVTHAIDHGPTIIIGNTTVAFTNPAVGSAVTVTLDGEYSGADGQSVYIGTEQYSIEKIPPPTPSTTLYLVNLSDTTDAGAAIPAADILSVPELTAGRMGAYGMGRNWMSLTDGISFIAGDIVGGASGTQANSYRDAVLKTTENDFLSGGGTFRLPGSGEIINAMWFTANLDTALGQGNLLIGTDSSIFSCATPMERTDWTSVTNPILTESLKGFGPLAQNSTVLCNSDTIFRSIQGLSSLIIARRNFNEWGNTPISREVDRIFAADTRSLLSYGSSVVFDNRLLASAAPQVSANGVFHAGIAALNFDLLSNLRGKSPPCYDGLWTGLNIMQNVSGMFDGIIRAFCLSFNKTTQKTELYELLPSTSTIKFDNNETKIVWAFETPVIFREDIKPFSELIRLLDGEINLKDIVGDVTVRVLYRPDFYPCWKDWKTFTVCADTNATNSHAGYLTKLSFGDPPIDECETGNNRNLAVGHVFQLRFEVTGPCKFMAMRISATTSPQSEFIAPVCDSSCGPDLPIP